MDHPISSTFRSIFLILRGELAGRLALAAQTDEGGIVLRARAVWSHAETAQVVASAADGASEHAIVRWVRGACAVARDAVAPVSSVHGSLFGVVAEDRPGPGGLLAALIAGRAADGLVLVAFTGGIEGSQVLRFGLALKTRGW